MTLTKQCVRPSSSNKWRAWLFIYRLKANTGIAGLAIILVTFIVSLASIVVVNLTYSTFLSGRSTGMVERQLQAEYALKSLVNVAAALIAADQSPRVDSAEDVWGVFMQGAPVPDDMLQQLGFTESGIKVWLEITPENAKLRIDQLDTQNLQSNAGQQTGKRWKDVYTALFKKLHFDDELAKPDHTGLFPNQVFNSEELAENLETYQRTDVDNNNSNLPTNNGKITRIGDLINIPGFTPKRISVLTPFVTVYGNSRVNVNVAKKSVLEALDPDLNAQLIIDYRNEKSIENIGELREVIGEDVFQNLAGRINTETSWFQVIGKIEFGGGISYFARAIISAEGGAQTKTNLVSLQLY